MSPTPDALRQRSRLLLTLSAVLALLLSAPPLSAQQTLIEHVTIESAELGQTRELLVFEPLNYEREEYTYFDVIYVFDAQLEMLFHYVSAVANLSQESGRGLIVVGIRATQLEEEMYFRNNDLLPSDTEWNLPGAGGNAEAFLAYVKNEVVPYVESTYRTLPHRTAIGHSLSASFAVYAMLHEPDLFDNVIAVSPNLEVDDHRLVRGLRAFDSGQFETPRLFYMSHANEAEHWPSWGAANTEAYALLRDTLATDNFRVVVEEYPDEGHMSGFMPSVSSAMRAYFENVRPKQSADLGEEEYEVTFRVTVPEEGDELYVAGNQASLGDWDPGTVRMERVSPLVREVTISVRDHVEVKFYREGGAQAWIANGEMESWGRPRTTYSRMIRPEEGAEYAFEVVGYQE